MITVKTNPYKSVVVESDKGKLVTISEGNKIQFVTESGELKEGNVVSFKGKGDKLEIELISSGKEYKEIWSIMVMKEGTLKLAVE